MNQYQKYFPIHLDICKIKEKLSKKTHVTVKSETNGFNKKSKKHGKFPSQTEI